MTLGNLLSPTKTLPLCSVFSFDKNSTRFRRHLLILPEGVRGPFFGRRNRESGHHPRIHSGLNVRPSFRPGLPARFRSQHVRSVLPRRTLLNRRGTGQRKCSTDERETHSFKQETGWRSAGVLDTVVFAAFALAVQRVFPTTFNPPEEAVRADRRFSALYGRR